VSLFVIAYLIFILLVFTKAFDKLILEHSLQGLFQGKQAIRNINEQHRGLLIIAPLSLLAFAIPYYRVSASIPTILLVLGITFTLIRNIKDKSFKLLDTNHIKVYAALILGYLIFIGLHCVFFKGDFQKLQLNFLLLFYFLAFLMLHKLSPQHFVSIAKFYILGALCFVPFVLVIAAFQFDNLGWKAFYYTDLLSNLKANPITHSLYYNIAIIIAAKFIKDSPSSKEKLRYLLSLFVFVFMLVLFGSKTGYLTGCLSISFIGLSLIRSKALKIVFIISIPLALFFVYTYVPYINKKTNGFKWQITRHEKIILEHRLPRSVIWPQAISLIKENPIKGVGLGRSIEALSNKYLAIGYPKGVDNRFNAHNQFLESWLQLGFFGIFWWILFIGYMLFLSIRKKEIWLGHFIFLLVCYLLVESLFESQMGMVAVAFFSAFFILQLVGKDAARNI
jgi:O-antigen ligase